MSKENKRSKYWNTMVDILDGQFPKGECMERGQALVMLAYIEMMLQGFEFNEDGKVKKVAKPNHKLMNEETNTGVPVSEEEEDKDLDSAMHTNSPDEGEDKENGDEGENEDKDENDEDKDENEDE